MGSGGIFLLGWRPYFNMVVFVGGDCTSRRLYLWVGTALQDGCICGWRPHFKMAISVDGDRTSRWLYLWVGTVLQDGCICGWGPYFKMAVSVPNIVVAMFESF